MLAVRKAMAASEIIITIISLAKAIGLKVIAEVAETKEKASFLLKNGCDKFQGYRFGKPVSADTIPEMLE